MPSLDQPPSPFSDRPQKPIRSLTKDKTTITTTWVQCLLIGPSQSKGAKAHTRSTLPHAPPLGLPIPYYSSCSHIGTPTQHLTKEYCLHDSHLRYPNQAVRSVTATDIRNSKFAYPSNPMEITSELRCRYKKQSHGLCRLSSLPSLAINSTQVLFSKCLVLSISLLPNPNPTISPPLPTKPCLMEVKSPLRRDVAAHPVSLLPSKASCIVPAHLSGHAPATEKHTSPPGWKSPKVLPTAGPSHRPQTIKRLHQDPHPEGDENAARTSRAWLII